MSAQRKASGPASDGRHGSQAPTARKGGKPERSWPRRIVRWGLLLMLAGFLLGCAAFAYGYVSTDIPDPNKDFQAQTTMVYYKDGRHVIGRFATQNRTSIPLAEVPQHVQDAVIAAEDRSFYTNKGIDPKGILRAAFSNARGNSTQGASTITQQYVKIYYLSQERTVTRKIKEAFLSLKIQRQKSKNEILQDYLNTIYFGRGAYGIQAAAQAYFGKDAKDLSVGEGAVLASVLNAPGYFDPADGKDNRVRLEGRYRYVLDGMVRMGTLSRDVADRAERRLPRFPKVVDQNQYGGQKGYMLAMVKKELEAHNFSDSEIEGGGLRVTTTFTRTAMKAASDGVRSQRPRGLKKLHIGVASVDPRTGALRGFYAGQDYLKSHGAINWATAKAAPGSAFKPFALSAGMKDGFALKSTFDGNSPYLEPDGRKVVNEGPNGGNDYGSKIPLLKATEESVNTAYVDMTLAMDKGGQKIMDTAVDMGIPKDSPGLAPVSGISLGSASVSPVTMANAYGTMADGGQAKSPFVVSKVQSAAGDKLYENKVETHRALPNDIDRDVSYALQQVVKAGTGQNAMALGRPAAGKTGTATNADGDVSSSWFVGYTPQLSTAVMYVRGHGNDALNGYLPSYFGADYPTRTWTAVMKAALAGEPVQSFPPPAWVKATQKTHLPLPKRKPKPSPTPSPTPSRTPSTKPGKGHQPQGTPTTTCVTSVCLGNGHGNGHGKGHRPGG